MDTRTENERIERTNNLAFMPANPWEFDVHLGRAPHDVLTRLTTLLGQIAKFDSESWPADDYWKAALPGWMKACLPEFTKEESDRLLRDTPRDQWDKLPWEFGSWLDAIRDRGWRWWGYRLEDESATLVVHIAMFPERIDAFREILRAAGAAIVVERYEANSVE
ncbi:MULTISPECIES: hypothetical protein [unclassified Xanthomonas]|uniref:hypothetical protein n=1 Tax=unclassified Xanthomonas TaxID=2643310 RepID=UPI002B235BA5|nr:MULTISPECIES: hypothetical protein [unclassified Xanthomonas]MEA9566901.1 hypothetical protein [Xanthomonas sp. WHRI 8932A]MEA9636327.1 hypothetical protein [Xanthomonas sp. WHRI 8812E]